MSLKSWSVKRVQRFHIKEFIENWTEGTKLIYQNEGSLGSRLHKVGENLFLAYALWPNEYTLNCAIDIKPSKKAKELKRRRNLIVEEFKILHKGEVIVDLISSKTNKLSSFLSGI